MSPATVLEDDETPILLGSFMYEVYVFPAFRQASCLVDTWLLLHKGSAISSGRTGLLRFFFFLTLIRSVSGAERLIFT